MFNFTYFMEWSNVFPNVFKRKLSQYEYLSNIVETKVILIDMLT